MGLDEKRYKCHHCKIVITEGALVLGKCPQCNSGFNLMEMCPNDTIECQHEIVDGLAYCEICGEGMCPICHCHDISQSSRITGLTSGASIAADHRNLSDVDGWNNGKKQELKDRHRVNI